MQSFKSQPKWLLPLENNFISNKVQKINSIKEKITAIYFESKQRYGSPRITIELNAL